MTGGRQVVKRGGMMAFVAIVFATSLLLAETARAEGLIFRFFQSLIGTPDHPTKARIYTPDSVTRECIACHDGRRAVRIDVKTPGSAIEWEGSHSVNHPIGSSYAESYYRNPREYVDRSRLDPAIRLPNGEVSCISCHQLKPDSGMRLAAFGPDDGCTASKTLTVSMSRDSLCLACHTK